MKLANSSPILGHEKNIKYLQRIVKLDLANQSNLSGTYILSGPDKVGKKTILFWFIQSLLCQQNNGNLEPCNQCPACQQIKSSVWPDLHIVKKAEDKKNISIEQIREMINKLSMSSFLNGYKLGIIYGAESLSISAANALLKLLEEPNQKVLIFLLVSHSEELPATIVSRSQVLNFRPLSADLVYDYLVNEHQVKRSTAKHLSHLAVGRPGLAIDLLEDKELLDQQLQLAKILVNGLDQDINERLQDLSEAIKGKTGQTAVNQASLILDTWQNITRDLLLINYDQVDLVQYQILLPELEAKKNKRTISQLLNLAQAVAKAKQYLKANVNPKLALEQVIINI